MARRKCTMTGPLCDTLLKAHVATIDDQVYASEDQELLVKHYLGFLAGTAHHTNRLNTSVVAASATRVFGASTTQARRFAEAMAGSMSYCLAKAWRVTTGRKLSGPVKSVLLSFQGAEGKLQECQLQLRGLLGESQGSTAESRASSSTSPYKDSPKTSMAGSGASHQSETLKEPPTRETLKESPTSARDIWKLYGGIGSPPKQGGAPDLQDILSSQEAGDEAKPRQKQQALEILSSQEVAEADDEAKQRQRQQARNDQKPMVLIDYTWMPMDV